MARKTRLNWRRRRFVLPCSDWFACLDRITCHRIRRPRTVRSATKTRRNKIGKTTVKKVIELTYSERHLSTTKMKSVSARRSYNLHQMTSTIWDRGKYGGIQYSIQLVVRETVNEGQGVDGWNDDGWNRRLRIIPRAERPGHLRHGLLI